MLLPSEGVHSRNFVKSSENDIGDSYPTLLLSRLLLDRFGSKFRSMCGQWRTFMTIVDSSTCGSGIMMLRIFRFWIFHGYVSAMILFPCVLEFGRADDIFLLEWW